MANKISDKTKGLIIKLYDGGLTIAEVSRRADVSYSTAYGYTKIKQRVNPKTGQPFASRTEYQEHLAKQRVNPETGQPFDSLREYREHLAKQRGFASRSEYQEHLAKQRVNPETGQPFDSLTEYQEHLAKQRQQNLKNQRLSNLIKGRLLDLGKTRKWLAKELGIAESSVSRYFNGKITPRKSLQDRLFRTLGLSHQTLEDLLEDGE